MLKSYLKTAIRNLSRNRIYSLINIGGLCAGLSACLLIVIYVNQQLSYDRFHEKSEWIYRIQMGQYEQGELVSQRARVFGFLGPQVVQTFPEIRAAARLINLQGIMGNYVMSNGEIRFKEDIVYYADQAFFDIFTHHFIEGDADRALTEPHTIVMTKSFARKYFGDVPTLGKSVVLNGSDAYRVTGIIEDVPENSHLPFDFLLSFKSIENQTFMLGWADFLTYVLLEPGTSPQAVSEKLNQANMVSAQLGEMQHVKLALQPVLDIHLYSRVEGEAAPNGSATVTYGLALIAFLILLIAWINYVNLSTARSLDRAREVGMRKVVGARPRSLISQFLLESLVVNFLAVVLALIVVMQALPAFSRLTGQTMLLSFNGGTVVWSIAIVSLLAGTLFASMYPAWILASFQPITALKAKTFGGQKQFPIRKILLVTQFAVAVILIAATTAVFKQMRYLQNQDLGVDIAQTLIVRAPSVVDSTYSQQFNSFKQSLSTLAAVQSVTAATNIPGRESTWGGSVRRVGTETDADIDADFTGIDYDFIPAFGMNVLAGRNFSRDFQADRSAVLLNEAAARQMGWEQPEAALGKRIVGWRDETFEVIGVLENHHQLSPQYAQSPTVFFLRASGNFYAIKLASSDLPQTIDAIEQRYQRHFAGNPFDYYFLDEYFSRQFRADLNFGKILGFFSALAILIACLGLFALTADIALKRMREIGIRKVLGATLPDVVVLLSRDFMALVAGAILIGLPVAAMIIQKWLENYASRIEVGWSMLATAAILVIAIALLTVSMQAVRAALSNPIDTLRSE